MRITTLLISGLVTGFVLSGCTSTQVATGPRSADENTIAMTAFASEQPRTPGRQPGFRLGAGDALGQAIFANYAVLARANAASQYASGSSLE